ncbi:MAG: AAA family ATPase [Deltaproteobacteria bacterium]|nr:AAA family ATPase [Deltaproteobacteria bacterium]
MELNDEVLSALLQAVKVSPDSAPLRRHYAEVLLNRGYMKEAEAEFHKALDLDPADAATKLGLARALHSQNQHSNALLLVKQVIRQSNRPAKAYILYARLLLALGSVSKAATEYRKGIDEFPEAFDSDLASTLGIPDIPQDSDESDDATSPASATSSGIASSPSVAGSGSNLRLPGQKAIRQLFSGPPGLGFSQVGGMGQLKHELDLLLVRPLRDPAFTDAFSHGLESRLLLYGPPGSGKTHLARALAGELLAPFLMVNLQDLEDVWGEDGAAFLAEIFRQAKDHSPTVLLLQEAENADRILTQQLLKELDDVPRGTAGPLVLLTSDTPWSLPSALLRSERFDRRLFLPPPTPHDRTEVLRLLCLGKPQRFLSHAAVAEATEGFSARDLRVLVDNSLRQKLRQSLEKGQPTPLATGDLVRTAEHMEGSINPWLAQAREALGKDTKATVALRDLSEFLEANPNATSGT